MSTARLGATRVSTTTAIAGAGLLAGVAFAAASAPFDSAAPWVLLALVVLPLSALAVYSYPLVGLILIFLSFAAGNRTMPGGLQVPELAVLAVATALALRRLAGGRLPLAWSHTLWWAIALWAWTVAGLVSAIDYGLAVKQIAALVGGGVLATLVLTACRSFQDLRIVLWSLAVAAAGVAASAIATGGALKSSSGGADVSGRLEGVFSSPNELGSFCALAAFAASGLVLGGARKLPRLAAAGLLAVLLVGLTLSLSRGAWIGAVLAALYLLAVLPEARRALLVVGIPLVAVAAGVGAFDAENPQLRVVNQRVGAITTTSPYDNRTDIWNEALREIRVDPITGSGPGGFPVASLRAAGQGTSVAAEHAHNIVLTWASESGIPAVLLIAALGLSIAVVSRRASRVLRQRGLHAERALLAGVIAALISILGQGLFDYTLRNAVIFLSVWSLLGIVLAAGRATPSAVAAAPAPVATPAAAPQYDHVFRMDELQQRALRLDARSKALRNRRRRLDELERELQHRAAALESGSPVERPQAAAAPIAEDELERTRELLERRIEMVSRRERELARRHAALALNASAPPQPEPLSQAEPESTFVPQTAPEPAEPEPVPAPQPPSPAASWGTPSLEELDQLVREHGDRFPERADEWSFTLLYLRDYAQVDGTLPVQFHDLVDDVFGDLLDLRHS